jgi:hypothetical protein
MRSSPSGREIPDEIIRYSFPLTTALAGKSVAPLWSMPGVTPVDLGTLAGLLASPLTELPGRLGLTSLSIASGGGNTGDKISLQWLATTTLAPAPIGAPVLNFVDPTQAAGVVTKQLDFTDIVIPDTGAAIAPSLAIPANLVVNTELTVLMAVAVFWKGSTLRNKFG